MAAAGKLGRLGRRVAGADGRAYEPERIVRRMSRTEEANGKGVYAFAFTFAARNRSLYKLMPGGMTSSC